jgi:glycosyltransferase involved in cell wall biosynthesis
MRVGIYAGSVTPTEGGSYTLLETIKTDIFSLNCKYDFFFFFEDRFLPSRFIDNKITYINLNKGKPVFKLQRKILKIFGKSVLDNILHSEDIDLLWILGPYDLDITIPYVFTVWDLGHRILPCFPEVSIKGWIWSKREKVYQKMLYRAMYIITGNETGKKEILDNYPVNPTKIHIIPFPIPEFCFANIEEPYEDTKIGIKSPFVFYPAQFWAHKNHIAIIEAIVWIRDVKNVIIHCYFVGSDKGNENYIKNTIKKYKLESQIFILGFVDKETLVYLYKNALAMIYASLLGPNNLPPLEAAAFDCPLIMSNIPGHVEQMEGSCLLVDVTDPIVIGEAILSIYHNPDFRQNLITNEHSFIEKYRDYSYYKKMQKIIDAYSLYCKTWKEL